MLELKEKLNINDMKYNIRGGSEITVTKYHDYLHDKIVTYYDIGNPILTLINFLDAFTKLERNQKI